MISHTGLSSAMFSNGANSGYGTHLSRVPIPERRNRGQEGGKRFHVADPRHREVVVIAMTSGETVGVFIIPMFIRTSDISVDSQTGRRDALALALFVLYLDLKG